MSNAQSAWLQLAGVSVVAVSAILLGLAWIQAFRSSSVLSRHLYVAAIPMVLATLSEVIVLFGLLGWPQIIGEDYTVRRSATIYANIRIALGVISCGVAKEHPLTPYLPILGCALLAMWSFVWFVNSIA